MSADQMEGTRTSIHGVMIGILADLRQDGTPLVACPAISDAPLAARATVPVQADDMGAEVALMFEGGDPGRPLIMGLIVNPGQEDETVDIPVLTEKGAARTTVQVDDGDPREIEVIEGKERVVLKCGRASITLTRAGKVLIRGAYVSSRSSGVNRIKGGSVHLN